MSNFFFNCLRYRVSLLDGYFLVIEARTHGWVHAVLNYIGPNEDQGIKIYHNGEHIANGTKTFQQRSRVNGRIIIGKVAYMLSTHYASLLVDSLLFFNRALTEEEITMLSQLD